MGATGKPITVVSFNVLCPQLADQAHFPRCTPRALDPQRRLDLVRDQLRAWMRAGHIICLQEVSRAWAADFTVLTTAAGYACVHAGYGPPRQGYMGVLTAWPRDRYELLDCNTDRLADSLRLSPPAPAQPSVWRRWSDWLWSTPPPAKDAVTLTCERYNRALSLRFKSSDGRPFGVVNYHMPCQWTNQDFMTQHVKMLLRAARVRFLDAPYVVAGDFNIRPGTPAWDAMSAAAWLGALSGPAWTCWADTPRGGAFQDQLDYVIPFGFREERLVDTALPAEGPLPTLEWPSDHVPIIKELVQ